MPHSVVARTKELQVIDGVGSAFADWFYVMNVEKTPLSATLTAILMGAPTVIN